MEPHEIKDLRSEKKLTQSELGEICGVSKASVSKWEKGTNGPSGSALIRLRELRDGSIVVTELTEDESDLLDQNIKEGHFGSPEAFLQSSLIHLRKYGRFDTPFSHRTEGEIPAREKRAQAAYARGSAAGKDASPQNIKDPYREEDLENGADGGDASTA